MAEFVHLELYANDERIEGESTQTSLGREGTIECFNLDHRIRSAIDPVTGRAAGRRVYEEFKVHKRLDSSTPLIIRALCNNEEVRGIFRFYRPHRDGDGTTEHFFTIEISEARLSSYRLLSPDARDRDNNDPPMEEVGFIFHNIRWCDEANHKEHADSWKEGGVR